jgi:ubiquinone/menaquinone biosynthesis C-methylase UbiE
MQLETAIGLIEKAVPQTEQPQHWADLGAGRGLFTQALASLLPPQSSIVVIDKDERALKSIKVKSGILLRIQVQDFTEISTTSKFDGVLMANALHYVQDADGFLSKLKSILNPAGQIVIIEYERRQPNPWVPYPINFERLIALGQKACFQSIIKLREVPSVYDSAVIYSAVLK